MTIKGRVIARLRLAPPGIVERAQMPGLRRENAKLRITPFSQMETIYLFMNDVDAPY
jgi:hypothetical protein